MERKNHAKGSPQNAALKLALNGAYGKSNDEYSFLYDPEFTMKITINGQLLLTMLAERLQDNISDLTMLQINTDGMTMLIPRSEYDHLVNICKKWEARTNLDLEYVNYKAMFIRNVNNYIGQYEDGSAKHKGALEVDRDWHKNHSMRAVRLAVSNYFLKGIPVKETFLSCDIFDFCKAFRVTKGWTPELHKIEGVTQLQKTNRYFVSKAGGTFYKHHSDGRLNAVEAGVTVEIMNDYNDKDDYLSRVDINYYVREANKIISDIENTQLSLF